MSTRGCYISRGSDILYAPAVPVTDHLYGSLNYMIHRMGCPYALLHDTIDTKFEFKLSAAVFTY